MEHFDVLIVGAGLSGIGAAAHLKMECAGKSFAILEGRAVSGGTWDLFRYPGVRSDSDMFTLGYRFRPWNDPKAIADGPSILKYIRDTAEEFEIDKEIRYEHRVKNAAWSTDEALWTVEAEVGDAEKSKVEFTCNFFYLCTGYYDYDKGYTPDFEGMDEFQGRIVHPQKWTDDIDYANKKVIVIGSGATAVTLVPALAEKAAHVTMLQRSPTYVVSRPAEDKIANFLRAILPSGAAYAITRWKNVLLGMFFYNLSRKRPEVMKGLIAKGVKKNLGEESLKDFTPTYDPWDQRLCLVPDADLFHSIKEGKATVVTDHIVKFTPNGIELKSGEHLDADIIVTATGLVMKFIAGMQLVVDGEVLDMSKNFTYKGMMFSDVPNLAIALGYTNASWTLKCDLTAQYICRMLKFMDENGYAICTPRLNDPTVERIPVVDFNSGYIQRAIKTLPSQGSKHPWRLHQNYVKDLRMLRHGNLEDGTMEFKPKPST
jgi:cation diffusion facilitator CzcD-associated flavoprotein CzcO